jgi:hypothetical protein
MTVTFDMGDRSKFIFFRHSGKEYVRFVDFWGGEETVTLDKFLEVLHAEQKRRFQRRRARLRDF